MCQTYRCIAENELGKIQSRDVHVRAGKVPKSLVLVMKRLCDKDNKEQWNETWKQTNSDLSTYFVFFWSPWLSLTSIFKNKDND